MYGAPKEPTYYQSLKDKFRMETGLEASGANIPVYLEYLKANSISQIVVALAEINNRLVEIKMTVERVGLQKKL